MLEYQGLQNADHANDARIAAECLVKSMKPMQRVKMHRALMNGNYKLSPYLAKYFNVDYNDFLVQLKGALANEQPTR